MHRPKKKFVMFSFLIYILIQIILGFSLIAELLATSWNVAFKSLKYTSKLTFNLKPRFHKRIPRFQFETRV